MKWVLLNCYSLWWWCRYTAIFKEELQILHDGSRNTITQNLVEYFNYGEKEVHALKQNFQDSLLHLHAVS